MIKELAGARVAILAEDLYEEVELWYPYYRLKEAGATVTIVGSGRATMFTGKHGLPVTADVAIDSVSPSDFDAVVIPGGFAPDLMRRKPAMIEFVHALGTSGKPVGAICHGGSMLISARLVKDRKLTSFFSIKDDVVAAGATYVDAEVVRDGNVITSRVPADLPAFLPEVIAAIASARSSRVPAGAGSAAAS
ncbi:MAG TPA: type 1 glutamine amidotransferase domain-containing protein [Candidatus Limnocylindria bacterium]|nr:type 1 glutamine amidotransferase domain-containing protein [Candidatus Limnocylindria bacterium]